MRPYPLALAVAAACSNAPQTLDDASTKDASTSDASVPSDASVQADAGTSAWSWCPSGSVTDATWPSRLTTTGTVLCTYTNVGLVADALRDAIQLSWPGGEFPWPEAPGTYPVQLPLCGSDRDGSMSAPSGNGSLKVTTETLLGDTLRIYTLDQPLLIGGVLHTVQARVDQWDRRGKGIALPPLVWDDATRHGDYPDYEIIYGLCEGSPCTGPTRSVYPCAPESSGREATIVFDRGTLTVTTHLFMASGPAVPAALTRARGTLDGVAFDETDYFQLAHRPDHHNWGGGFVVLFDAPIAGACGISAQVPSRDGTFWVDRPSGATIECDLSVKEELTGVMPAP